MKLRADWYIQFRDFHPPVC